MFPKKQISQSHIINYVWGSPIDNQLNLYHISEFKRWLSNENTYHNFLQKNDSDCENKEKQDLSILASYHNIVYSN